MRKRYKMYNLSIKYNQKSIHQKNMILENYQKKLCFDYFNNLKQLNIIVNISHHALRQKQSKINEKSLIIVAFYELLHFQLYNIMGSSHSTREQKHRQLKNDKKQYAENMIPLESKPPSLNKKIVLKNITQNTRESNATAPVSQEKIPQVKKPAQIAVSVNPYELGGEVHYGYAPLFEPTLSRQISTESKMIKLNES